jgi:pilus assembly protein Flp/PilA
LLVIVATDSSAFIIILDELRALTSRSSILGMASLVDCRTLMSVPLGLGHPTPTGDQAMLEVFVSYMRARLNMTSERGAAGVESGLLVALIAAVIVFTVIGLGTKVNDAFATVRDNIPG